MVNVNFDVIADRCEELIEYDGFLPLFIRALIMNKWSKYLIENNLYDEIMQVCADTKPYIYEDAVKELVDWIKDNPQYKDMIK